MLFEGDPVPVDPKHVKAVWEFLEREKREYGSNHMVGLALLQHECKVGPDFGSIYHRMMVLRMLKEAHPEIQINDAAFAAIAKLPIKCWMEGTRRNSEFDREEFLRLCKVGDAAKP
jgi:hypothetical protein